MHLSPYSHTYITRLPKWRDSCETWAECEMSMEERGRVGKESNEKQEEGGGTKYGTANEKQKRAGEYHSARATTVLLPLTPISQCFYPQYWEINLACLSLASCFWNLNCFFFSFSGTWHVSVQGVFKSRDSTVSVETYNSLWSHELILVKVTM